MKTTPRTDRFGVDIHGVQLADLDANGFAVVHN